MTITNAKIRCPSGHRLPIDSFGTWVDIYCRDCKRVVKLDKRELSKVGLSL